MVKVFLLLKLALAVSACSGTLPSPAAGKTSEMNIPDEDPATQTDISSNRMLRVTNVPTIFGRADKLNSRVKWFVDDTVSSVKHVFSPKSPKNKLGPPLDEEQMAIRTALRCIYYLKVRSRRFHALSALYVDSEYYGKALKLVEPPINELTVEKEVKRYTEYLKEVAMIRTLNPPKNNPWLRPITPPGSIRSPTKPQKSYVPKSVRH